LDTFPFFQYFFFCIAIWIFLHTKYWRE
jgi:hypothetical protein